MESDARRKCAERLTAKGAGGLPETSDSDLERSSASAPLRSFDTRYGSVELLSAGDGVEVIRHRIARGGRFGMVPAGGWTAFESVTVLSGRLHCLSEEMAPLVPGDTVSAWPVVRPRIFEADEDTVLFHVASEPVFQTGSEELAALQTLAREVAERDGYTHEHCLRVQNLAAALGGAAGLPPERIRWLMYGALLHDVGKSRVPADLIRKPGPLDTDERAVMRQHPSWGREMVSACHLGQAGPIIEQHHERLDGSGYPYGLHGDEITVEAQIVAIADTFDAITTTRSYHLAESVEAAVAELRRCAGTLFRPDLVELFAALPDLYAPKPIRPRRREGGDEAHPA